MDKVTTWVGGTQTPGFFVDVFHDSQTRRYFAKIHTYRPSLPRRYIGGSQVPVLEVDDEETLEDADIDKLRELVKQQITLRCGTILDFSKK